MGNGDCHNFEPTVKECEWPLTVARNGLAATRPCDLRGDVSVQDTINGDMARHGGWLSPAVPVSAEMSVSEQSSFPSGRVRSGLVALGHRQCVMCSVGDGHADEEISTVEQDTYKGSGQLRWLARWQVFLRGGCKVESDCLGHRQCVMCSIGDGHADEEDSTIGRDTYKDSSQLRWLATNSNLKKGGDSLASVRNRRPPWTPSSRPS